VLPFDRPILLMTVTTSWRGNLELNPVKASHPLPLRRAAACRFRDFAVVQIRQRFTGVAGAYNHVTQRRILSRRVMRVEVQEFANYVKGNPPDDDMTLCVGVDQNARPISRTAIEDQPLLRARAQVGLVHSQRANAANLPPNESRSPGKRVEAVRDWRDAINLIANQMVFGTKGLAIFKVGAGEYPMVFLLDGETDRLSLALDPPSS
jgi:hypothetical protein